MSISEKIIFGCLLLIPLFFIAVFTSIGLCLMY